MANTIRLKYSNASAATPSLIDGEIAIGQADEKIFYRNSSGTVKNGFLVPPTWSSYTPTAASVSGTITSYTATGRYLVVGKTAFVSTSVSISNNGTGGGTGVFVSLPFAATASGGSAPAILMGREGAVTGKMLFASLGSGSSGMLIAYYDNTYPGANGALLTISGTYEIA